ncbi:hypothetical protein ETD86_08910 [Nonomuraea turkmeniaca]|uniref:Peroxidase n=1 Tax=Nonomuraea turkmeniaca TaxID=103838 RepID=A0A5S4FR75_9ACTN|nr:hypothetical protein [Nonomuraea turkmeniaca]TMR23216.1 hypothetical protein ETD86_08910 [Nonomuraea turkmeniaca]
MAMGRPGGVIDARDPLQEGPVRLVTNPELSPSNVDKTAHTAGVTFLGQFIDHDVTFDETSPLGVPTSPEQSPNSRTPGLDLDSVYGGGPAADPQLHNPSDPAKLRLESGGRFEDLPRTSSRATSGWWTCSRSRGWTRQAAASERRRGRAPGQSPAHGPGGIRPAR